MHAIVFLGSLFAVQVVVNGVAYGQQAPQGAKAGDLSPAQMLERFGIDPSQQQAFFNGQAFSSAEDDVLAKLLFRLPRVGRDTMFRWRKTELPLAELDAHPAVHRFDVYHLKGRATRVTKQALLPEQTELYEFEHYYRVTFKLQGSQQEAVVAARHVPAAWPLASPLDEPAAADALFLKTGEPAGVGPSLYFAAERVAWFPTAADAARGIGPSDVALARAGFDIGLWDNVRSSKEHTLAVADREAFYQLLAALDKSEFDKKSSALAPGSANSRPEVAKLLAQPAEYQGEIFPIQGIARRVTRVPVSDADVRARFGIDYYFEIDFFLPLAEASVRLGKPGKIAEGPVFQNEFPATLIVRRLPPDLEVGENVHQLIAADAVFFKVWAYRSNFTAKFNQLQPAPLFVAAQPRVATIETPSNWLTGTLVLIALGLGLAAAAAILWSQASRGKKRRFSARDKLDFRP